MRGKAISGATAVLILAFFFLPWFSVSFNGRALGQFSGYQLAVGIGRYALDGLNGRSVFFLIPLAALVVLLWAMLPVKSRFWPIVSASGAFVTAWIGLMVLVWLWRGGVENTALILSAELGFWLTLFGFLVLLMSALFSFVKGWRSLPGRMEADPVSRGDVHGGKEETAVSQSTTNIISIPEQVIESSPKTTLKNNHKTDVLADDSSIQAWLIVLDGEFAGAKFHIVPPMRIGRDPGNDIVVDDTSMSGYHAVVREQGGALHVQDINSTNGIYLENQANHSWQRVPAATLVNDMRIKLGRTVFHVETGE